MSQKISFLLKDRLSAKEEKDFLQSLEESELCAAARMSPYAADSKSSLAGRLGFVEPEREASTTQLVEMIKKLPQVEAAQVEVLKRVSS